MLHFPSLHAIHGRLSLAETSASACRTPPLRQQRDPAFCSQAPLSREVRNVPQVESMNDDIIRTQGESDLEQRATVIPPVSLNAF